MTEKKYGELETEKEAKENLIARNIVKEINVFQVTERQKMMIMYLLALELENTAHMQEITSLIRECGKESNMFLSDRASD